MKKYCLILSCCLLLCLTLSGCIQVHTGSAPQASAPQASSAPSGNAADKTPKTTPATDTSVTSASFGTLSSNPSSGYNVSQNYDISASSVRSPIAGIDYGAYNLGDNSAATAWVEGVSDYGVGQSVSVFVRNAMDLNGLMVYNGYAKSEKAFAENGRVKTMSVYLSDGTRLCTLSLSNHPDPQYFIFPNALHLDNGASLEFVIDDVYVGPQDGERDTALSEIGLLY